MATTTITPCPATSDDTCKAYDVVCFGGTTTVHTIVTHNTDKADEWIDEFIDRTRPTRSNPAIVGLDVQYGRPPSVNYTVLLQVCVNDQCLIFQFNHAPSDLSVPLLDLFGDYNHTFVGVGVDKKLKNLRSSQWVAKWPVRLDVGNLVAEAYGKKELKRCRLRRLCEIVLEKEMDKDSREVKTSDWSSLNLTEDQVIYATVGAYVSYQIGVKLAGPGPHPNSPCKNSLGRRRKRSKRKRKLL